MIPQFFLNTFENNNVKATNNYTLHIFITINGEMKIKIRYSFFQIQKTLVVLLLLLSVYFKFRY